MLRWELDNICRREDRIEVYDVQTSTLVWSDDDPEWESYYTGTPDQFEYRYLDLTGFSRGDLYKWRIRSYEVGLDGSTVVQTSPWSSYGIFGIPPLEPNTSGSVQNGHPKLSWAPADGATGYTIRRKLDTDGSWGTWDTTSSTSFTDYFTPVLQYLGEDVTPSGNWVAYSVRSTANGMQSSLGSVHYFSYDPDIIIIEFAAPNEGLKD